MLWLSLTLDLFSLLVRSVKVPWFSPHTQRAGWQGWLSQQMVLGVCAGMVGGVWIS